MASTRGSFAFGVACVSPSKNLGILSQRVFIVVWPNGEDGGEVELQLLASHSLKRNLEVEGADGYDRVLLPWEHESFLHDVDIFYATSSDDKIGVCVRHVVTHGEQSLRLSD